MNKIEVEGIFGETRDFIIEEDTVILIKNSDLKINYSINKEVTLFQCFINSKIEETCDVNTSAKLNIFAVNTTLDIKMNLNKDDINLKYTFSTINEKDNTYKIDINHLGNNITSNIINHGLNTQNSSLSFIINTIVSKSFKNINTSQDSKIIVLKDKNATIKPNLIVDNDDVVANHSAYIGSFKKDEVFYLKTRGLTDEILKNTLAKAFLVGGMDLSFREKNIVLDLIKEYWR